MRFDVRYRTLFSYHTLAVDSHNEVRACPATTPHQQVIDYELHIAPPASVRSFVDGWGTVVDSFGVRLPHIAMEVVAEATVETITPPEVTSLIAVDRLDEPGFVDDHFEYLLETPATRPSPEITDRARAIRADTHHVLGLATSLQDDVRRRLTYRPGITTVSTTAAEAYEGGQGVCQDYAHLMVSLSRAAGLPARYVSGYFFSQSDADGGDSEESLVTVQTHAWVEVAIPGERWLAMDPTNGVIPTERHVKIGHGSDYDAVTPFRGTFIGPETSEVTASVQIRRRSAAFGDDGADFSVVAESELRWQQAHAAAQQEQEQQQQ